MLLFFDRRISCILHLKTGVYCGTVPQCGGLIPVNGFYVSVSQPPGRGPVPDPGINYTGPRVA